MEQNFPKINDTYSAALSIWLNHGDVNVRNRTDTPTPYYLSIITLKTEI